MLYEVITDHTRENQPYVDGRSIHHGSASRDLNGRTRQSPVESHPRTNKHAAKWQAFSHRDGYMGSGIETGVDVKEIKRLGEKMKWGLKSSYMIRNNFV